MILHDTPLKGLKVIKPKIFQDNRGEFVKIFNDDFFQRNGLQVTIQESYYSVSNKNVIRGMHFQLPPFDHEKIVYVSRGEILDVVLDIRKDSKSFGQYFSIKLSESNAYALFIPKGFAHGFKSLREHSITNYLQTSVHAPEFDTGVRYDSFGFDWECTHPIVSERDLSLPVFEELH